RYDHVAFGLAVKFVYGDAQDAPSPVQKPGAKAFPAASHRAHTEPPALLRVRHSAHRLESGWRNESITDAMFLDQIEGRFTGEFRKAPRHNGHAVVKSWQQHVEEPADPSPVRGRPNPVPLLRKKIEGHLDTGQMAKRNAMCVKRTFGQAGRSGGVNDERRVVRARFLRLVRGGLLRGSGVKIERSWRMSAYAEHMIESRQPLADSRKFGSAFRVGDDGFCAGVAQAMLQRLLSEESEERDRDRAHLEDRDMAIGGLGRLRQQHADAIALPYSMRFEEVRRCVRAVAQGPERDGFGKARLGNGDESGPLRLRARPPVADIRADVIEFWHLPDEAFLDFFVSCA